MPTKHTELFPLPNNLILPQKIHLSRGFEKNFHKILIFFRKIPKKAKNKLLVRLILVVKLGYKVDKLFYIYYNIQVKSI